MEGGGIPGGRFICSGPRAGASGEDVPPPTTVLHNGQAVP